MKNLLAIDCLLGILLMVSCRQPPDDAEMYANLKGTAFSPDSLHIKQAGGKCLHGQVLYLPVYSSIPKGEYHGYYDLSAFLAIHNTDMKNKIRITRVYYFNNEGQLVRNYLKEVQTLNPLAATSFFVPIRDKSGTGSNFLVEWMADSLVNEPLVESVMLNLASGQGVSFISQGKVIRESQ